MPVPQRGGRARSRACWAARPQFICSPGTYDQKHIARIGHLHDCVAYGPGILDLAHQPDEFVAIDDLVASAKVMALATLQLLGARAMIRPGPRNGLTDVAGLLVGNAEDHGARTGVTVVLAERPALAAVDVRGGAPGTINTDLLRPGGLISQVDGIVLSGGSVFGLEAATGLIAWLAERGRGLHRLGAVPADRVGRDPVRPGQWRRQGLGRPTALSRISRSARRTRPDARPRWAMSGRGSDRSRGRSRAGWARPRRSTRPPGSRWRRWWR